MLKIDLKKKKLLLCKRYKGYMVPESWNDPENIFLCSKVRRKGSLQPPVVVVFFLIYFLLGIQHS